MSRLRNGYARNDPRGETLELLISFIVECLERLEMGHKLESRRHKPSWWCRSVLGAESSEEPSPLAGKPRESEGSHAPSGERSARHGGEDRHGGGG